MPWNVVTSDIGWNSARCQMFAWTTETPGAKTGDVEGQYCMVNNPRYKDKNHNSLLKASSGAATTSR